MELRWNYVVNCVGHIAPVNLVKGLTRLTGLTDLGWSGEPAFTRQIAVKQEYSVDFVYAIEQAAIGFVNLVKGLTRLTGLTDMGWSGEPAFTRQIAVKQEYSVDFVYAVEQAAIGFVNLVKGLTQG